jgi:hypothetical protein
MSFPIRASCFVIALSIAGPALAQQAPGATGPIFAKQMAKRSTAYPEEAGVQARYFKYYCGARFVCYTGIPLNCGANTRPYQNVAAHQCFCLRDDCPQ